MILKRFLLLTPQENLQACTLASSDIVPSCGCCAGGFRCDQRSDGFVIKQRMRVGGGSVVSDMEAGGGALLKFPADAPPSTRALLLASTLLLARGSLELFTAPVPAPAAAAEAVAPR